MADLYGTNDRSSSFESEEMSSFLHNILHNSSPTPSPSSYTYFKAKHIHSFSSPPPPPPVPEESASAAGILFDSDFRLGDGASTALVDSSSDLYFSDTGGFFPTETKERTGNSFSSAGAAASDAITASTKSRKFSSDDDVDDFGFCEGALESEVPANSAPSRSSKRTRAAEIHNLSEKRRRSRINEKLKALQNLIPNSNKTDKASMLDEAIDYLKQLQLQVQMLTMRNGLSLHPVYMPEKPQPLQLPQRGVEYDDRNELLNANRGNIFSGNQEIKTPTALHISTNITNSEASFGLEPSIHNHYGLLNHLTASKDICQIDAPSQLQLDINSSGKNSSSGVSKPR